MTEGTIRPSDVPGLLAGIRSPVEVEIGMGGGHFLVEYARRNPEHHFIGVEMKHHRVLRAVKKIASAGITNATVVMGDANAVIELLPSGSIEAFHLYFLDPWPKNKHRKRRFLRGETVSVLLERLRPGGRILFATDMLDYFIQAKILFILCGATSAASEPPEETHLSVYSTRFREHGTRTHFAVARKPTGTAAG